MGQIRIAVYDQDATYTGRFCQYVGEMAGETYVFSPVYERTVLDELIASREVEAVLVSDELKNEYPSFIGDIHVGYLTGEPMEEQGEIFRYQSRRELLGKIDELLKYEDTSVKLYVFAGAGEGCGCSAAAAACAESLVSEERKVLYINMNSLGDPGSIFRGGNPRDLGFLLRELGEGGDMDAAMGAVLNRDTSGIYFFDNASAPLSLMDISEERMEAFLRRLVDSGEFRYIIVDSSFSVNHGLIAACRVADRMVLVSDGTYNTNGRLDRIWQLFGILGEGLCQKTVLLYNKFHKQYGRFYENSGLPVAGCIEVLPPASPVQMAEQMMGHEALRECLR